MNTIIKEPVSVEDMDVTVDSIMARVAELEEIRRGIRERCCAS